MHVICKKYTYNHVHDATLLQTILMELVGADRIRALKDEPAPNTGTAHSVANSVTFLNSMMNINIDSDYTESAYGASRDSSSSEERRKSLKRENKKAKNSKPHGKRRKRRTRTTSQRRTYDPIARNTTTRSPIVSSGQMHVEQEV